MARNVNWKHLTLELFVVFLGVTAGFILNNWRGNINDRRHEIQYLESFRDDVITNLESLSESIDADSLWKERATPLIRALQEDSFPADSAFGLMSMLSSYTQFQARTGTWEDITNSGNLNLIRDFELKRGVLDYHVQIESVAFIDEYFFEYFDRALNSYIMSQYSFAKNQLINPDVSNTLEFANVATVFYSLQGQRYNAYQELRAESDTLLHSLNQALSK
jgi:hypothetical protein